MGPRPGAAAVTIFEGEDGIPRDDDAYARWRDFVPAEHIGELGAADNFWSMGDTGPCGRCSEIYVRPRPRGARAPATSWPTSRPARDRFVEIWNNVFMEFDRGAGGVLAPLPARSIDTGMGLERIAAVLAGPISNYDTALFTPLLDAIGALAHRRHGGTMDPADVSMRVIADHLRAMTFLIADGVVPSNEWRGYVLRKIMRRAMRHGRKIGLEQAVPARLVDVLVAEMGGAYPELVAGRDAVMQVVRSEEDRFEAVLSGPGIAKAEQIIEHSRASRRRSPATRRSCSTRPSACRATSSRTWRRAPGSDSTPRGSTEAGAASRSTRARAARSAAARRPSCRPRRARTWPPVTRGLHRLRARDRRAGGDPRPARRRARAGRRASDAARAAWSCSTARPSMSRPAARYPTRGTLSAPRARRRAVVDVVRLGAGLPRGHRVSARPSRSGRRSR